MALIAADIGECPCNILEVGHLGGGVCVQGRSWAQMTAWKCYPCSQALATVQLLVCKTEGESWEILSHEWHQCLPHLTTTTSHTREERSERSRGFSLNVCSSVESRTVENPRSYSSRPFLCALVVLHTHNNTVDHKLVIFSGIAWYLHNTNYTNDVQNSLHKTKSYVVYCLNVV